MGIVWVIIKILGVFKMLNGFLSMVNVTLTIKSLNEVIGGELTYIPLRTEAVRELSV